MSPLPVDREKRPADMDLEKLLARIREDAGKECGAILDRARREAAAIEKDIDDQARREGEALLAGRQAEIDRDRERALGAARLAARREVLARKRAALDEVYRAALAQLTGDRERLRRFFRRALAALPPGEYRLETGPDLADILPEDDFRGAAGKTTEKAPVFEFTGRRPELAGRVLLTAAGVEITLAPERLLDLRREALEPELARLLFPASGEAAAESPPAAAGEGAAG